MALRTLGVLLTREGHSHHLDHRGLLTNFGKLSLATEPEFVSLVKLLRIEISIAHDMLVAPRMAASCQAVCRVPE